MESNAQREALMEVAQKMMVKGFEVQTVSEVTGLDVETLSQLETE